MGHPPIVQTPLVVLVKKNLIQKATCANNQNNAHQARTEAHTSAQRLSPEQEQRIVDFIFRQEKLGYAPSHAQVVTIVGRLSEYSLFFFP
jgi:hypothetical protein